MGYVKSDAGWEAIVPFDQSAIGLDLLGVREGPAKSFVERVLAEFDKGDSPLVVVKHP